MFKDRKSRILGIVAVVLSVFCLTIGYAALSSTLTINSNVLLKGVSWKVEFDNISSATIVGDAKEVSAPVLKASAINLTTSLTKKGDKISYTFDVMNKGTIDAKLSSIPLISGIPEAYKDIVKVDITYSDNSAIAVNDDLLTGAYRTMKVSIEYVGEEPQVETESFDYQISMIYVQK